MLTRKDKKLIIKALDKTLNALKKKGDKYKDLIKDYETTKQKLEEKQL